DYCSWYIEMSKPRLAGDDRSRTQQVLVFSLDRLLRMLHPFVPFVTEALWELLGQSAENRGLRNITQAEPALVAAQWPQVEDALIDPAVEAEMQTLHDTIRSIREIRTTVNERRGREKKPAIRSLPRAIIRADRGCVELLESRRDFVTLLAGCDLLEIGTDVQKPIGSLGRIDGAAQVYVPVADLIEINALRDDENAELTRQRAAYAREEARLANQGFVQRADPSVVEQARSRAAELSRKIELLEQHLADLG
ncbi:MAG: class I tRNA ligase family protein, partial [Planctomycetota bacterium]|nr:class I tRNA ligase family protein [Planctomycetota bacterium]